MKVDKHIYATQAENALHLTDRGWQQALCAGRALKDLIADEPTRPAHAATGICPTAGGAAARMAAVGRCERVDAV